MVSEDADSSEGVVGKQHRAWLRRGCVVPCRYDRVQYGRYDRYDRMPYAM